VTAQNVADSLKNGGNTAAFKIGGQWYDLLNPAASTAAYFVPANAIPQAEVGAWRLGKWFKQGNVLPVYFE
jgi:hypothetical protein